MDVPTEYRSGSRPPACLGHPSHLVESGEMLCRTCGHFVRGAMLGAYQVLELLGMGRSGRA